MLSVPVASTAIASFYLALAVIYYTSKFSKIRHNKKIYPNMTLKKFFSLESLTYYYPETKNNDKN